jgi:hypothetical protein
MTPPDTVQQCTDSSVQHSSLGAPPSSPYAFQVFLYFSLNELDGKRSWEGEGKGGGREGKGGGGGMMSERENSPGVVPI